MNKRKIVLLATALCMIAILAIGGTLAYFTDTDSETNTFTVGNVKIDLKEIFDENNAVLRPGSQTTNKIEKKVWIANTGSENAYVWYEWYIPSVLDSTDGSTGTNNIIHVNSYGYTWDKYRESFAQDTGALPLEKTWDHDPEVELKSGVGPEGFVGTETIDSVVYNKYVVLYHGKLAAGEETTPAMKQVYMDSKVDTNAQGQYTINGKNIDYNFANGVNIIVRAYGIQADGFADVYEAYQAYQTQQ